MRTPMSDSYTHALADVRSCLAAMADLAPFHTSTGYEGLLLEVDSMHGVFPATYPVTGTLAHLRRRTEARLDQLAQLGADPLDIELIVARLADIGRSQSRDPPHRGAHSHLHSPGRSAHRRSTQRRLERCRSSAVLVRDPHHR